MDGWITIATDLNTKEFEKKLKQAESELKSFDKEAERLSKQKAKIELDLSEYEKQKQLIQETTDDMLKYASNSKEVSNIIDGENTQIASLNQKYAMQFKQLDDINSKIKENEYNQGLVNNQVQELNSKLSQSKTFDTINRSIDNVGKAVQNVTRKIGQWALAVFSVRGAYMAIRNAINVLTNDDKQLKADIDYMKRALAYTLEPIVRSIINLFQKLMFYIAYIIKAWTGKNIFANANKNLNKATGSAKSLNKELQKTTASFDEMNVLQNSSSGGSGDVGVVTPSFDFSKLDGEVPKWLKWIVDNKDLILSVMAGVAAGLLAWKLGLTGIQSLGIGLIIGGIVYSVKALIDYLKDPSWENFGKIITGIGIAILGLSLIVGGLPVAITGAVVLIFGLVAKYWDKIKVVLDNGFNWLFSKTDWVREHFGIVGEIIYNQFLIIVKNVIKFWDTIFTSAKNILDGIIKFVKGVFTGNWKLAWEGLKQIFINVFNLMIAKAKLIFGTLFEWIKLIFNKIIDLGKNIGYKFAQVIGGALRSALNGVMATIENVMNSPIKAINGLIKVINKVPGVNVTKLVEFKLPRLAKGGIINQPGRGVMLGSAIGGEAGPEAVLPLDDVTMDRLGSSIARHMSINATLINQMNGRVISKELQKINNESDFAFNR